jgi:chemotaxis methyl-accepting protein methylase
MNALPPISIEPYDDSFDVMQSVSEITPYSELFRADARLGDVLQISIDNYRGDDYFRVISAGCSFGAELDSVLATLHRNTDIRGAAVLGVDANPIALSAANMGKYVASASQATLERAYLSEGLDFVTEMQQSGLQVSTPQGEGTPVIDATLLREESKIKIQSADLLQPLPTAKMAHVILCNNVLFHQTPSDAEKIAANLTRNLAVGGVVSFGANQAQTGMEGNKGEDYLEWSRNLGKTFKAQGIEPVLFSRGAPFAFQRH